MPYFHVNQQFNATLHLLKSSIVVALSGGFRLHIAFLLAGLPANIPVYCAGILVIYATYTLDRTHDCREDMINRAELCGADRRLGIIVCIVTFILGLVIFAFEGIYIVPFFPFIVGYFYTHGIRIGAFSLKLKGGMGIKNIITGVTWGGTIALTVNRWCSSLVVVGIIFLFFGVKTFVTSCMNDFKDAKGDTEAGILTLPVCLGEDTTKTFLILLLLGLHGVMFYLFLVDIMRDIGIVLLIGLVILVPFLHVYSPAFENKPSIVYQKMREVAVSWESAIALAIQVIYTVLIQTGHSF
jgi:4-hydroxybenzoate polyprenyltransferase